MRPGVEQVESNHAGRGVLLMLGGVVMGAAVALLTAPQSGERTRRQLVRKAEDAKEQATELYDDVTEAVADLRRDVTGKLASGKKYLDKTRRNLLAGAPGLPNRLSRLVHTLRG